MSTKKSKQKNQWKKRYTIISIGAAVIGLVLVVMKATKKKIKEVFNSDGAWPND